MTDGHTPRDPLLPNRCSPLATRYSLQLRFEAYVATPLGEFANRTSPRERIWLVDAGEREAQLRWLLLAPNLRGHGLGRRLVEETIAFSRVAGYESIFLWTVKELVAAGRLYAALGFRVTFEETHELWGGR